MTDSLVLPAITAASTRPDLRTARTALTWGHRYLMVRPDHFRVDYAINPFMDPTAQPDPALALAQWVDLVADASRRSAATVEVVDQRVRRPGHGLRDEPRPRLSSATTAAVRDVVISHMRYAERRMESESARAWFDERPRHHRRRTSQGATVSGPLRGGRRVRRSPGGRWSPATGRGPRSWRC